jgi:cold shock CspA family protein
MEKKTEIGSICSLRLEKGYAFIEVPGEHHHIFVHATGCPHWEAPLAIGDKVSFRRGRDDRNPDRVQAFNCRLVDGPRLVNGKRVDGSGVQEVPGAGLSRFMGTTP